MQVVICFWSHCSVLLMISSLIKSLGLKTYWFHHLSYPISVAVTEPSSLNTAGSDTSQMTKFTRRWKTSHPFSLVRQVPCSFLFSIFNIQVCGKQFERRRRWCLDQHMLSHETERKFNCDICGKFFRNSSYLKTHRKACLGVKVC